MNTGAVTCPAARATKGRRRKLSSIWNKKEHKEKVRAFVQAHGDKCQWCGSSENLTAHHPYLESYSGCYTDLELSGCIVLCSRCHFSLHKGLVLCPVCKQHYHRVGAEMCKACFLEAHPEIVKAREEYANAQDLKRKAVKDERNAKARAAKRRHPCTYHRIGGACGLSKIGSRCPYARTKALRDCGDAVAKKGARA